MSMQSFHLGDVLSITTGRLLSPEGMAGVYRILNHMTGRELYTHQLPRAADACAPVLLERFPQLADIELPEITPENLDQALGNLAGRFGESFEVPVLPAGSFDTGCPASDLRNALSGASAT